MEPTKKFVILNLCDVKDGIVDYFERQGKARPDVDKNSARRTYPCLFES